MRTIRVELQSIRMMCRRFGADYVEQDCAAAYGTGRVAYARYAFDGLALMNKIRQGEFEAYIAALQKQQQAKLVWRNRHLARVPEIPAAIDCNSIRARRRRVAAETAVPAPPFWGARIIDRINPRALVPYLNERSLFQFRWGFRKSGRTLDQFMAWARQELLPVLQRMLDVCEQQGVLQPQGCYCYWKAAGENNDLIIFAENGETELARITLPRQARAAAYCIADFVRDVDSGERDVIGLQVVRAGARVSDVCQQWFDENRYQDYLYLHGLGVEMAEALTEFVHKRIHAELGFAADDSDEITTLLRQGYRGSRFSFGHPACPQLEDQVPLFKLLGAERLGVVLSDEFQIHPEQSTSALVIHHPRARYFTI